MDSKTDWYPAPNTFKQVTGSSNQREVAGKLMDYNEHYQYMQLKLITLNYMQ